MKVGQGKECTKRLSGDGRNECLSENVTSLGSVEVEDSGQKMGVDGRVGA